MWHQVDVLIWLFPIAFMLHDFEEIVLWESWMGKNGEAVAARLPTAFTRAIWNVIPKRAEDTSTAIFLIFVVTVISTYVAAQWGHYEALLLASGMFFVHGFGHFAQAILLRTYVPGVVTSAVIIMPFGAIFFPSLVVAEIVDLPTLLIYFVLGAALMVPSILGMHKLGSLLHAKLVRLLVG